MIIDKITRESVKRKSEIVFHRFYKNGHYLTSIVDEGFADNYEKRLIHEISEKK